MITAKTAKWLLVWKGRHESFNWFCFHFLNQLLLLSASSQQNTWMSICFETIGKQKLALLFFCQCEATSFCKSSDGNNKKKHFCLLKEFKSQKHSNVHCCIKFCEQKCDDVAQQCATQVLQPKINLKHVSKVRMTKCVSVMRQKRMVFMKKGWENAKSTSTCIFRRPQKQTLQILELQALFASAFLGSWKHVLLIIWNRTLLPITTHPQRWSFPMIKNLSCEKFCKKWMCCSED